MNEFLECSLVLSMVAVLLSCVKSLSRWELRVPTERGDEVIDVREGKY